MFDLSLDAFLDLYDSVSVRLYNAVRFGASEGRLPYLSLGAYLAAGPERIDQMLRLPALGRKSVQEFEELATRATAEFCSDTEPLPSTVNVSQADIAGISAIFDISLDAFLTQQPIVSRRLMHAILNAAATGESPFATVSAYIQAGSRRLTELRALPNLGLASAQEFDTLVQDAVRNGTIVPPSNLVLNQAGFPDLESLMGTVFDALDERQSKLLLDRVESASTLDAIARDFGLTRARIQQIEHKMVEKLTAKFGAVFLEALAAIDRQCRQRGLRELTLHAFSELAGADVITCGLYFKCLKKLGLDDTETWVLRDRIHLYCPAEFAPGETWDERVDQALIEARWPLVFQDFVAYVRDVPRHHIAHRLCERYHAAIDDDAFTQLPRLSVQKMCLHVLASTRAPMHLTEIRAGVFKYFGIDLTAQHVTSTVGNHADITICAPGTYARYVDLPYSRKCIEAVCHRVYEELRARQVFLSSTLLFDRLFAADLMHCPAGFNHHLLLGFAQDDARFVTKRGNMIGLVGFDIATTYVSLEDEVRNIVFEHGPIGVNDIITQMAETRKFCNDASVKTALASSPDIIQVGRRTYDSLHRFFADRAEYDALVLALRITLLAGAKSLYALANEMAALGVRKASTEVISSILEATDDVTQANGMYCLGALSTELQAYQAMALASLVEGGLERLQREADAAFGREVAAEFIRFDRRFEVEPSAAPSVDADSELNTIMADFEF